MSLAFKVFWRLAPKAMRERKVTELIFSGDYPKALFVMGFGAVVTPFERWKL
jgi:hypothetical protein